MVLLQIILFILATFTRNSTLSLKLLTLWCLLCNPQTIRYPIWNRCMWHRPQSQFLPTASFCKIWRCILLWRFFLRCFNCFNILKNTIYLSFTRLQPKNSFIIRFIFFLKILFMSGRIYTFHNISKIILLFVIKTNKFIWYFLSFNFIHLPISF